MGEDGMRWGRAWRRVAGRVAVAGVILAAGWVSWLVQHAGDAPRPAADIRYEFGEMSDVPVDAGAGHFVAAVPDRLAARRPPELGASLLGPVRVDVDGVELRVALNADGALCATGTAGDAACAGGAARRGSCPKDADCAAGDSILAAAADVVVTDWSIENPSFETVPWRVRIWRIAVDRPQPLIELDLPDRPAELWVSRDGVVVELVVAGVGGGPWRIVRCVIGDACTRHGPFVTRPTIRSALAAALASAAAPSVPWPEGVNVDLDACQVLWRSAVEVRGQLTIDSPLAAPLEAGFVELTIVRPDGEPPTRIPLTLRIEGAGAFSFVVENSPLGYIIEPDVLGRLLAKGSCELHHVQPDGQAVALTASLPLN